MNICEQKRALHVPGLTTTPIVYDKGMIWRWHGVDKHGRVISIDSEFIPSEEIGTPKAKNKVSKALAEAKEAI